MSSPTTSKILIENLTALHKAREAYVARESSDIFLGTWTAMYKQVEILNTSQVIVFTLDVLVKDDEEVLEKCWTKTDSKS